MDDDSISLLKPEQIAAKLGIGRSKVYAMAASGELQSVRIGGSVRFPRVALRNWIESQTVSAS